NAIGTISRKTSWSYPVSSIQLKDFARERGQPEAAMLLGVTQGALSKAIRVGRNISVVPRPDGTFSAEETRPFPSRSDASNRAAHSPTLNANVRSTPSDDQCSDDAGVLSSTGSAP
ncbi:Cro/CI family transcriptional regulator, partial [Pseudomonas syringae]